jgi:carbon-monoxide dehydrogenase medium subunit
VKLPPIDYLSPISVEEVVRLLGEREDAKILSGGQSLMPMLAFRLATPRVLVDLRRVSGLDRIHIGEQGVELGAKVRWRDIERDTRLAVAHPLLAEAVRHIAHYQIRNRGTVGGSLAHADPAAELPAIALTCDAHIVAVGPRGEREIPAAEFFLAPLVTALEPDELIVAMRLPAWPKARRFSFKELSRRLGDFALAGAAVFFDLDERGCMRALHVGAFGVADKPVRLLETEAALNGTRPEPVAVAEAIQLGTGGLEMRSDIHTDADYRRALLETLLTRAFDEAMQRSPS